DIGHQMLLRRLNMIGDPENAYAVKKGEDNLCNSPVDAMHKDIIVQHLLKTLDMQIDHMSDKLIHQPLLPCFRIRKRDDLATQLLLAHLIDMGDLKAILVQERDIEKDL